MTRNALPEGWYDVNAQRYGADVAEAHGLLAVQWRSDRPISYTLHVSQESDGQYRWNARCDDDRQSIHESGWAKTARAAMNAADRWANRRNGR